jgi:acyl-coenzyme A thioesterase PaaI-like protein
VAGEERRARAASLAREFGHEFVARDLNDEQLDEVTARLTELVDLVRDAPPRQRVMTSEGLANFKMAIPRENEVVKHQLFSDSVVSGAANPMGLGGYLWREGDTAVMEVTLGKAFEGAPGQAHGGIVAALLDETMGLVNAINEVLAFTAQLDITFLEPTPVNEPITARARLARSDNRKHFIEAELLAGSRVVATASALFIAVDPSKFLRHMTVQES